MGWHVIYPCGSCIEKCKWEKRLIERLAIIIQAIDGVVAWIWILNGEVIKIHS